jgi:RNA polymerase sigma factor for flagellar operon FliA
MTGPADREFVEDHAELVRRIASRVRAQFELTIHLEDLVAYGFEGLLDARTRFDPSRGVLFSTFAYYRIRGAIIDGVRRMAYLPHKTYAHRKAAEALDREAEAAGEDLATRAEREESPASLQAIDDILARTSAAFVMAAVGQAPEDDARPTPEEALSTARQLASLREVLHVLPERERALVEGHYFEDRTLEDVGAALGMSKSWASRLHARALATLREALEQRS